MKEINVLAFNKIYFCGICGVNMSALAMHCKNLGIEVRGSDSSPNNKQLESLGIIVKKTNDHKFIKEFSPDAVVYTSAINIDCPEIAWARKNKIAVIKRSELLSWVLSQSKKSVGISGCHGKTTSTAMLVWLLKHSFYLPTAFIGGNHQDFGNYLFGDGQIAVAECCEFQKNFLDLFPTISVVLNVDNDHMDSYKNFDDLVNAYKQFSSTKFSVINGDDQNCKKLIKQNTISFGLNQGCTIRATNLFCKDGNYSFDVYYKNQKQFRLSLGISGFYNVYNALSVIAVAKILGLENDDIVKGLESFTNVKRRMEVLGVVGQSKFYADYAHHPKEIASTLNNFLNLENTLCVFQPHTYSRTNILFCDFVEVLGKVPNLCIYKTYSAREKYKRSGSAKVLYKSIKKQKNKSVKYFSNYNRLKAYVKRNYARFERVVFFGAGDIYDYAIKLVAQIKNIEKLK